MKEKVQSEAIRLRNCLIFSQNLRLKAKQQSCLQKIVFLPVEREEPHEHVEYSYEGDVNAIHVVHNYPE